MVNPSAFAALRLIASSNFAPFNATRIFLQPFMIFSPHDQYGTGGMGDDSLRRASHNRLVHAAPPVRPHDDHVVFQGVGNLNDLFAGIMGLPGELTFLQMRGFIHTFYKVPRVSFNGAVILEYGVQLPGIGHKFSELFKDGLHNVLLNVRETGNEQVSLCFYGETILFEDGGDELQPSGALGDVGGAPGRSDEHTSELQSPTNLVCRLL